MAERSNLNNEIQKMINNTITEQPYPTLAEITRIYNDGYVDIRTNEYGELTYLKTITSHNVGDTTILIFLNNTFEQRIVI
jgi:hypothetical protein